MNEDYVINTIRRLQESEHLERVPWLRLTEEIKNDLQLSLNTLVSDGRLKFNRDINKQPMFGLSDSDKLSAI